MTDMVNHPPHYTVHPSGMECIEITRLCSFDLGNAIKYIWRYDLKDDDGAEGLKKARWYLNDLLTTGQSRYLPHKAKGKLETVNQFEPFDNLRRKLFSCLLAGEVTEAINLITVEVKE